MGNNARTKELDTVEIDGGNYVLIVARIRYLAEGFDYSIDTNAEYIEPLNAWKVKSVLTVKEEGRINVYSGHACEVIGSSEINTTSALENAETSSVGRACAFAGIGVPDKIASADDVTGANEALKNEKVNQKKKKKKTAESKALDILTANRKNNEK